MKNYDAAHHLISITDNFNNRIEYGYDLKGNRTNKDAYDPLNLPMSCHAP
jgi:YD repeat-containing protein